VLNESHTDKLYKHNIQKLMVNYNSAMYWHLKNNIIKHT